MSLLVDNLLLVGLLVLAIIVVVRLRVGRRKSAEIESAAAGQPAVKSVQTVSEKEEKPKKSEPAMEKARPAAEASGSPKKAPEAAKEDIVEPLVLIKTFSAPPEKRLQAIKIAAEEKLVEAVPALIEVLYEPDSSLSAAAAEALGKIGDSRAIEPLLEISRRTDVQLMKEISDSVGSKEDEGQEVAGEESQAEVENPYNFKEMVVFKIDQLPKEYFQPDGTPIPRKDLVVRGLKDNNAQLRQMAAKAAIGLDSEDVVGPLIEALENPYEVESVRFMAAEALGGMENEKSIESLLRSLKDENVAVRYSAAAALSGHREESVVMALIGAVSDPDKYVRSSVAYALGASGSPQALKVLFECVTDESEVVSFTAAKAIACYDSEEVIAEVKKRLEFANKKMRLALLEILGQIKNDASMQILRGFLQDNDNETCYRASMALMGHENLDVLDELVEASRRFDQELFSMMGKNARQSSLSAEFVADHDKASNKTELKLSESLMKLREGLQDKNPNLRGSAANALGDAKEPQAVDLLLEVLDDENEFVRASAVSSLGRIASERALAPLLEKANDYSEEVRYALVKALARFSHDGARACLKQLAGSDQSSQVKRAARAALDKK